MEGWSLLLLNLQIIEYVLLLTTLKIYGFVLIIKLAQIYNLFKKWKTNWKSN